EYGYDDIPDYKFEYQNYLHNDKVPERPISNSYDFRLALKEQYCVTTTEEKEVILAHFIIDSLTDAGLMEQKLESLAEDLSFKLHRWVEESELEVILLKIQQLEPIGIGARSIKECLLIQLLRMNKKRPDVKTAIKLLDQHFNDLHNRNMDKIKAHLNIDEEELKIVLRLIASLKMRPVCEMQEGVNQNIVP
ncbi:MAG: RNA polymerase sigma-54 factor, partial [Bacteroidota bacterium]